MVSAQASLEGLPQPAFEIYIGTPVWLGAELFATLSFSSPYAGAARAFSTADRELIELMARSIGRVILEHRIQSERDRLQSLEKNRNCVLEMVAENESIEAILTEVARLVEEERPGALCSLLILKDEVLAWASAPSFPQDAIRILKPFRVLRGTAALATAEVARTTVFWEDIRACPFWAERGHLAAQMGIVSCRSSPILSADGVLLGILALHYKEDQPHDYSDTELLQAAGRLAGARSNSEVSTNGWSSRRAMIRSPRCPTDPISWNSSIRPSGKQRRRRASAQATWPCCSSIWIASNRSTISWAMPWATGCCEKSASV
jgi:GAF domain-containing protein